MSDENKKPLFYGDAHPELAELAGDNLAYLSRLVGVKLAGLALDQTAETSADVTQIDRAIMHKAMMDDELARYEANLPRP